MLLRSAIAEMLVHSPPSRAGKREASIGGAGVGGKAAAKLLSRYGSLEAVLQAAAAGELKGWGPAAQRLLLGGGSGGSGGEDPAAQLRRKCQLFAANADASVVRSQGMKQLLEALDSLQPAQQAAREQPAAGCSLAPAAELAWLQPFHAQRWRHLQQVAAAGQQHPSSRTPWQPQQAATPQGLAVDGWAEQPGGGRAATFFICPGDVAAGGWERALAAAQQAAAEGDTTRALMPLLSGAMRHHVKLVQRAGHAVRLALPPPLFEGGVQR